MKCASATEIRGDFKSSFRPMVVVNQAVECLACAEIDLSHGTHLKRSFVRVILHCLLAVYFTFVESGPKLEIKGEITEERDIVLEDFV